MTRLSIASISGGILYIGLVVFGSLAHGAEPPALNPFGQTTQDREDATPGYLEMSDGSIYPGLIYLTRDKRLQINDEKIQRQREIPLRVVKKIDCKVKKEWMEKEWKFKELAKDEKMFTGRSYPSREYDYTVTLEDDRTIEGGLSGVVYVKPFAPKPGEPGAGKPAEEAKRFQIHKRDKGDFGQELKSLLYVKAIRLGEDAYKEGKAKAEKRPAKPATAPASKPTPKVGAGAAPVNN